MQKKGSFSTIILILIFLTGLSLLLYPTISDFINNLYRGQEITEYVHQVANIKNDQYDALMAEIREYNESLTQKDNPYVMTDENTARYHELLNISGTGIMGYIEIPILGETMPMFHTVEEAVLQVAVGHLEWTSLPIGGESTHTVLSGHRGLPSARLFTDLDQLAVGDVFMLHVLDETLTYQVDQILIVEPNETEDLLIIEGEDLCTLVTCTPYGINSHRLLVRGSRIENLIEQKKIRVTADARLVEPLLVAPVLAAPMLLILLILLLWPQPVKDRRKHNALEKKTDGPVPGTADDSGPGPDGPGNGH